MKVYKLKHKATGLYFRPSKNGYGNLSIKGKLYPEKQPSVTWGHVLCVKFGWKETALDNIICDHWKVEFQPWKTVYVKTMTPDWEIEEQP